MIKLLVETNNSADGMLPQPNIVEYRTYSLARINVKSANHHTNKKGFP